MKVLALASYPERIASTRFRVATYIRHLAAFGIDVDLISWLDDSAAAGLYRPGGPAAAARSAVRGLAQQLRALARNYDVVWVQREAVLVGPPIVEAIAAIRSLPIVFDYDDAVWIAQGGALKRALKFEWKFDWLLRHSTHVVAGSSSLSQRARGFGVTTTVLPTVVERATWTPRGDPPRAPLRIGWIGTHSTAPQLSLALPALRQLRREGHRFELVVVGAGDDFALDGLEFERRPWRLENEIDDFRGLDIGLAPMHKSPWHEGKCGFKQVQYMAVGVPCVSSMVGGARDFVIHDHNALVAENEADWYVQLRRLMIDPELRSRLGRSGRELVETRLCVEEQAATLARLLRAARRSG